MGAFTARPRRAHRRRTRRRHVTRVTLKLGGSTAQRDAADANFGAALRRSVKRFLNSGRRAARSPHDRRSTAGRVEQMVVAAAEGCVTGDPMTKTPCRSGVSAARERVVA